MEEKRRELEEETNAFNRRKAAGGPCSPGPARPLAAASEEGQGQEEAGGGPLPRAWPRRALYSFSLAHFVVSFHSLSRLILVTFLLSVVIFTSSGVKPLMPTLVFVHEWLLPTLPPHTLFFSLSLLSFSLQPLKSWVEKAGPHRQEWPLRGS